MRRLAGAGRAPAASGGQAAVLARSALRAAAGLLLAVAALLALPPQAHAQIEVGRTTSNNATVGAFTGSSTDGTTSISPLGAPLIAQAWYQSSGRVAASIVSATDARPLVGLSPIFRVRVRSSDATLSDLTLSDGALSPGFSSDVITYTASVGNSVSRITPTETTSDANASVAYPDVDGNALTDAGAADGYQVDLDVGENVIKVQVTAEDGATKTYTVTVTRGGQTNTPAMGKPSITGTAQVGQTLTAATTGIADTDGKTKAENGDTGYAYTYQWVRVDGSNETDITGAASKTYIPAAADVGKTIKVQVSFTDDAGTPESLTSDPAGPVAQTVPIGLEANYPSIGAGLEDLVFTLTRTGAVKDELERTVSIVQAQKWLGASDLSRTVTFALSDEVRTRAPATGKPSIRGTEGTAWVGGTLTVVTKDIEDEDGLSDATYGYQWVRVDADGMSNATDITSETSVTYVPVEADVGKKVRVKVSFTDDGGDNEELTSDAYPSSGTIEAEAPGICGRTRQVHVWILDRIPGVNKCALVTDARLANITGTLDLDDRKIDTLAAGDFAGLTALTTLDLGRNKLTTLPDDVFEPLTALTGLYLNSNKLTTLDAGVFAGLPLQELRLESNKLTTLDAGVFAGLPLQELRLGDNKLTTLDAGVFAGLPLQELRLGDNTLNTLDAGVFAGLTELQELNLIRNGLNTLDAGVFAGLTALDTLRLEGNDLVTLDAGVFAGLTALDTLRLEGNDLVTLDAGVFAGLTALTTLELGFNDLTTLPDDVFEPLTALTTLKLSGNPEAPFAPVADALPDDGTVSHGGGTVTLNGSGSDAGPWGTNVTYGWALTAPTSGVTVRFDDDARATTLVTIEALAADIELTFTLTVTGRGGTDGITPDTDAATVTVTRVAAAGICGRTPVVRDRILGKISGVSNCALVTDARLADITGMLNLKGQNIAALAAGDFAGLTSLSVLNLENNDLTTLADGGFDGLAGLETLNLNNNDLTTLADGGFDGLAGLETLNLNNNDLTTLADGGFDGLAGLETLNLTDNDLTTLADEVFDGLIALETLNLTDNDLTTLADGVFDGLVALEILNLSRNDLTTLADGVFDGLAALEILNLRHNQLQSLPDGVFEPLTALTRLDLRNNRTAPFAPTADAQPDDGTVSSAGGRVALDGNGSDGGPWGTNVTYSWIQTSGPTSGVRLDDDASATPEARIPALAADTELTFTLTVTGGGGEDEEGVAPATDTAKVTVVTVESDPTAGVCGRTPAVRDALIDRLSVTSCGAVSAANLASITNLSLSGQDLTALAAGDFAGLTSLVTLSLTNTALTTLPGGVFDGLTSLVNLYLTNTALTTLPDGVFDGLNALTNLVVNGNNTLAALSPGAFAGLTSLTYLWLDNNGLENLPDGVFSGLTSLTDLRLDFNGLTALSPGAFAGLTSLKTLRLENNELATLPDDVFEPLTALTTLDLLDNDGAPFSPEAVALPDDGTVPVAGGMVPLDGSGSGGAWGTNVTYGWALTDPASGVTFDDDASPTPEVTIPALTAGTELTFTLTVTGRGGTDGIDPDTDTATVTSTASDDATLSALTVTDGTGDLTLDPTFAPGTFAYAAEVGKAVTTVTLTAMKTDDGASVSGVTLNGNAIADSDFTNGITVPSLLVGDNDIVVTVTAENGASQTYTVTVTRTNSAPTASNGSVTTDEDTAHTFAAVEFNFVDSDGGDALASVTVVTLPAAGALELNGTAVMADQSVLVAGIGQMVFTPEANANGMGYASFTFKVSDGTEKSALAYIMTVNVTAVNDPATGMPTISGTARVGETLTAVTTGIADADGPASPTYGYQWIRVDADGTSNPTGITGATSVTYIPVEADDGKKLRVKVSFTDDDSTDEELTSDAFPSSGTIEVSADICGRTGVVRRALLALISSVSNCADVTATHLAAIGTLDLSPITALAAGDFAGLTSLIALRLNNNNLATLPDGVFDGLTALRTLRLESNRLTTLSAGVFDGLTALRTLRLEDNFLATLPAGVFDGLTALTMLTLQRNRLTTLPAGVFAGLTALTTLGLYENSLTTLPAGVFDGLTALETLYLYDNSLTTLPAGVFDGLTALTTLNLSDNSLTRLRAGVFAELTALTGLSLTGNDGAPFAPKAVALPDDGTVSDAGGTVTLDGSGSGGAWGTNVTYGWALTTPTSGATFNDNTSPTPEVTIEALAPGTELTFTLTVTGRGGTDGITPDTDTATVTATGPPASDDATLSGLTVNDGTSDLTLDPTFVSATTSYAAEVANAVTTVTLTAMTTADGASVSAVTLSGIAIADSDFTDGITVPSLLVGDNAIVVTVTAEDGSTTQPYTVTVTRAGIPVTIEAEHESIGGGVEDLKFTLTRTGATTVALPVTVTLTQDQNWLTSTYLTHEVEFAAGEATKELMIEDSRFSFDPTTSGNLVATVTGTGVAGGTDTVTVISIADPPITIVFDQDAYSFPEGGPADEVNIYLTATLDAAFPRKPSSDFSIAISTRGGTATAPEDYATFARLPPFTPTDFTANTDGQQAASLLFGPSAGNPLVIVDDDVYEVDETFNVKIEITPDFRTGLARAKKADGTFCAFQFGSGGCSSVSYPVTITDDDLPTLSLAAAPASIAEEDDATTTGTVENVSTVTASIGNGKTFAVDQELTLTFTGTATYGTHYAVTPADTDGNTTGHQVTLTAGQTSVDVTVTAVGNSTADDDRDITIAGTRDGTAFGNATIVVRDDETTTTSTDAATGKPTIFGMAQAGAELTANTDGISDPDGKTKAESGDAGYAYTYQWVRVDSNGTSNETDIGSDSSTYTLLAADVGKKIWVKVSFTDDADNVEGPLTSDAYPASGTVAAAPNAAPAFTSSATFTAAENQTAVGTVTATDSDGDSVTDYAIAGGADQAAFSIIALTGVLTFTAAPNFEDATDADDSNTYEVVVRATSGTDARVKTADQPITVTVTTWTPRRRACRSRR